MDIVAAYIRVSTDDQLEYSPDSQLKRIREYAEAHGMVLPEAFIFREAGKIRSVQCWSGNFRALPAIRRRVLSTNRSSAASAGSP